MKTHAIHARENTLARMEDDAIAILYSGSAPHKSLDQNYPYTPQRNFYYLTGIAEENMILLLLKGQKANKTLLFIEKNTDHIIKWEGANMTKEEASEASGIHPDNIHYLESFDKLFNQMMNYARSPMGRPPKTLYLDLYHQNAHTKPHALKRASYLIDNYPELSIKAINEHLSYLRMFKSDSEIEAIKTAIGHTKKGLEAILANINKREKEHDLYADFLHAILLSGASGTAFDTIAASGENAAVLHYTDNADTLDKNDMILFDLGALHGAYASDISRTYPISGTYSKRQKQIYEIVLKVNKATIEEVRPGITWKHLNDFSKSMLAKEAKAIGLIDDESEITQYYYHSIGHFMGLDTHDVGHYSEALQPGMVLTIEPGLYIKDEGIGVRIEDDILVTNNGYENLSEDIPKEVKDIEAMIK